MGLFVRGLNPRNDFRIKIQGLQQLQKKPTEDRPIEGAIVLMDVMKTFKFRLYPNLAQQEWMARQFGACRFVYNHFLRTKMDYYAEHKDDQKKGLTYHDTALLLTQRKKEEGTSG